MILTAIMLTAFPGQAHPGDVIEVDLGDRQVHAAPAENFVNAFLRRHDANRDGVLSPEEVPEDLINRFAQTDLNGDGVIDAAELLTARTKIGRQARQADGLRLKLNGMLKSRKGIGPTEETLATSSLPAQASDVGSSQPASSESWSYVGADATQQPEIKQAEFAPLPPRRDQAARMDKAEQGGRPIGQPVVAVPTQPQRSRAAQRPQPTAKRSDGYPEPHEIIEALDKNGNGVIDRDEAVDQLADRFDTIDKNGDGVLDEQELARALRLAKMFGIKPKMDPRSYQK